MSRMIFGVIGIISIFACLFIASELDYQEEVNSFGPSVEYAKRHLMTPPQSHIDISEHYRKKVIELEHRYFGEKNVQLSQMD